MVADKSHCVYAFRRNVGDCCFGMNKLDEAHEDTRLRAADAVVAQLEARILSGKLADKQPLPSERELMEEFDISRTVVREAIATLSNRGLVESRPRFRPVRCSIAFSWARVAAFK